MKTETWHFYDLATGLLTGASFSGAAAELANQLAHKGPGVGAFEGDPDHLCQRVCLKTGALLDYKPDPPWDGTDLTLYVWWWDSAAKRWKLRPRLKKAKVDKWSLIKAARDAAIDAPLPTDWGVFDHHAGGRAGILAMAQGAAVTGVAVMATLADNSTVELSPQQAAAVLAISHQRVQQNRAIATELRAEIDAAGNAAAVDGIGWRP